MLNDSKKKTTGKNFPEITEYIYYSLDREKRKTSRDKGQYDASNVSYKLEARKLKDS